MKNKTWGDSDCRGRGIDLTLKASVFDKHQGDKPWPSPRRLCNHALLTQAKEPIADDEVVILRSSDFIPIKRMISWSNTTTSI